MPSHHIYSETDSWDTPTIYKDLFPILVEGRKNSYSKFFTLSLQELYKDLVSHHARFTRENTHTWRQIEWQDYFVEIIGTGVLYENSTFFRSTSKSKFIAKPELLLNKNGKKAREYQAVGEDEEEEENDGNGTIRNLEEQDLTAMGVGTEEEDKPYSKNLESILSKGKTDLKNGKETGAIIENRFQDMNALMQQVINEGLAKIENDLTTQIEHSIINSEKVKQVENLANKAETKAEDAKKLSNTAVGKANEAKEEVAKLDAGMNDRIRAEVEKMVEETMLARTIELKSEVKSELRAENPAMLAIEPAPLPIETEALKMRRYNQYLSYREDYRKAVFDCLNDGRLRIFVIDNGLLLNRELEVWSVKKEVLCRELDVPDLDQINLVKRKMKDNSNKFIIFARVNVIYKRRMEMIKRILNERNKHAGKMGISIVSPASYNISKLLGFYKTSMIENGKAVIHRFDLTKLGFLMIVLNDENEEKKEEFTRRMGRAPREKEAGTLIRPGCPKQFASIKNLNYEKLLKLADEEKYYPFEGEIYEVPKEEQVEMRTGSDDEDENSD